MQSSPAPRDLTKPTVLVVDDSLVDRTLYVHMVEKWGYPVEVASDGEQAIEIIRSKRIQLVLADWQMPGMMGTDLCIRLRKLGLSHYTYIILMSAQNAEEFLIKALDAGADDVLSKPVDNNELEARLQSAVRRIGLQASLAQQNNRLVQAYDLIAQDLRTVSKLQRSYLPDAICETPELDYRWLSIPSQYVSGDHLSVFALGGGKFGFYVLDVSGHGIPAAVKSMQLVQMFSDQSASSLVYDPPVSSIGGRSVARPRDVVARLNRLFQQTDSDLSYFTLIYGVFDAPLRHVTLCQAGHPNPLLLRADGSVTAIGNGGYPVGLFDVDEYEDIELDLGPHDALMLYSDGVTEVLNASGEPFGEDRLLSFLQKELASGNTPALIDHLQDAVQQWGGRAVLDRGFEDDVSILMLTPEKGVINPSRENVDALCEEEPASDPVFRSQAWQVMDEQALQADEQSQLEPSIVIVDDSRSFLRIFEAMLSSWGYRVHPAKSGDEAVRLIEEVQPDFVLTDWDMPGMSGIELCEQVRSSQQSNYTYIIMITGFASREELLRSLRVGADDFLTKPVNPSELKVRLKTALRISSLHKDLERKHLELSDLYRSLQRDMREVSRIQRSLLPKGRTSSWPITTQTLYRPRRYVCGKQMGTLQTQANELGFFMLSLQGDGTSTALQAMALARWFSMARATQVLFPVEEFSSKFRRYLAEPHAVWDQVSELSPTIDRELLEFDLLYGLINLDQGTLLVAGVGHWSLLLAEPGRPPVLLKTVDQAEAGKKPMAILYRDVIRPGSRVFALPDSSLQSMGLGSESKWMELVLDKQQDGSILINDFSRLSALSMQSGSDLEPHIGIESEVSELPLSGQAGADDIAIMGFQWREYFPVHRPALSDTEKQAILLEVDRLLELGEAAPDAPSEQALTAGRAKAWLSYEAVADTANIGQISTEVRNWVESHGCDDTLSYKVDLVLSEAMTNVMNHGFRNQYPAPIHLTLILFERGVAILLRDTGLRIPERVVASIRSDMAYMDKLSLQELPEGGMGLTFIRMSSRRFAYTPAHHDGAEYNQLALFI